MRPARRSSSAAPPWSAPGNELYVQFKAQVEAIVHAQERLCNRFLSEAEELLKKLHPEDGSNPVDPEDLQREVGLLLYRVKMGNPRSPNLHALLENPENAQMMNAAELELHADQPRKSCSTPRRNSSSSPSTRRATRPT